MNDKNCVSKAALLRYADITVGMVHSFERTILSGDVSAFAKLSGDCNPLHTDPAYGEKSVFKRNIVHGMLAASYFSTLVGMYCPGEKSVYLSQELNFRKPLFPGDTITARSTVTGKTDSLKIVTLKMEILRGNEVAIDGVARVLVSANE